MKGFGSPIINYSPERTQEDTFVQMKLFIKNLENKISSQQAEIESLKNTILNLEKEKIKLTSSLSIKENSLKDSTSILDNLKIKNEQFENKISELEKENAELNYAIAELTQKNKSLMNTQILNSNNQNLNSQIQVLTDQLNEVSIIKSKLEFDKNNLMNKLTEMQNEHENEIRMLTKIKNSEISQQNKTIANLQNGLNSLNNTINSDSIPSTINNNNQYSNAIMDEFNELEKRTKLTSDENNKLKKLLNELQRKNEEYENLILIKDKSIRNLQKKNKEIEDDLNSKNEEIIINSEENLSQAKEALNTVDQLLLEREDLIRQNAELRYAYEQFNNGVKEANDLFIEKTKTFENILIKYNKKIQEHQKQIKKLLEDNYNLNEEISKLKREKEKLLKKNEFKEKIKGNINLSNNNMLQSPNRVNSDNYYSNASPQNIPNLNYDTQNSSILRSRKNPNVIINNINYDINDPYVDGQLKSLDEFKKVLTKVDQNLSRDKITLSQE